MNGFPNSRIIRGCKNLGICLLLLGFFTLFIGLLVLGAQKEGSVHRRHNVYKRKETFAEIIERQMVCEKQNVTLNATVAAICGTYLQTKKEFYRLRDKKVSEYTHQYIINGAGICLPTTDVIILVHSLHSYNDRRDAIRSTWGGASVRNDWPGVNTTWTDHVQLVFVFGRHGNSWENDHLLQESKEHKDVIQGDFHESYRNMTLKSLLGLKWVKEYCSSAKYIIKSDDDMVLNIPTLLKVIHRRNMTKAVMGPFNGMSRVYRSGKWKVTPLQYPFYFYPPYESGSCYVITADLASPLFEAAEYVPHIFIDDVFITGIIGKILNVTHVRQDGFAFWTNRQPEMCEIATNKILTGTRMTPRNLLALWGQIKRHGASCVVDPEKNLLLKIWVNLIN